MPSTNKHTHTVGARYAHLHNHQLIIVKHVTCVYNCMIVTLCVTAANIDDLYHVIDINGDGNNSTSLSDAASTCQLLLPMDFRIQLF